MGKERLMAFTDAVLTIIMTILVLELEKSATASLEALWNLKENFFAYALSFFWLGTMWVNLKANHHEKAIKEDIANSRKRLYLDIGIKVVAFIITLTVFPSAMMISVLITMILMIIPVRKKV